MYGLLWFNVVSYGLMKFYWDCFDVELQKKNPTQIEHGREIPEPNGFRCHV